MVIKNNLFGISIPENFFRDPGKSSTRGTAFDVFPGGVDGKGKVTFNIPNSPEINTPKRKASSLIGQLFLRNSNDIGTRQKTTKRKSNRFQWREKGPISVKEQGKDSAHNNLHTASTALNILKSNTSSTNRNIISQDVGKQENTHVSNERSSVPPQIKMALSPQIPFSAEIYNQLKDMFPEYQSNNPQATNVLERARNDLCIALAQDVKANRLQTNPFQNKSKDLPMSKKNADKEASAKAIFKKNIDRLNNSPVSVAEPESGHNSQIVTLFSYPQHLIFVENDLQKDL